MTRSDLPDLTTVEYLGPLPVAENVLAAVPCHRQARRLPLPATVIAEPLPGIRAFAPRAVSRRPARFRRIILLLFAVSAIGLAGCATSIGVRQNDIRETYDEILVSAVNEDAYSRFSHDVLIRYNLVETFEKEPQQVLIGLHRRAENDYRNDLLFALAELNYFVAMRERGGSKSAEGHFFAVALYAYLYLLGTDWHAPPDPFDRRFRIACDLYNAALAQALVDGDGNLRIAAAEVEMPAGRLVFSVDAGKFHQNLSQVEKFVSADRFGLRGFSRRNREAGLGAPVIAVEKKPPDAPLFRSSPATLFLRLDCRLQEVSDGGCRGALEIYSAYDHSEVEVGDREIALERDVTAQIAYQVDQPYMQSLGVREFLHGTGYLKTGLFPMQPYEPDKIPIVLVHGTFSSPVAWAEMVNTLRADPIIAREYQIWNFFYDSGKRLGISAHELRDSLTDMVRKLDPEGSNPALGRMVVIGHSQGGLLTKLTATDTGDAFIRAATGKSLSELKMSEEDRALVVREAVITPLPFVSRVVFIATPHRGSFLSRNLVRTLVLRIIRLPRNILQSSADLLKTVTELGIAEADARRVVGVTSLDAMSPGNPIFETLADIPLAPGVKGHSIIAIDGDDMPPEGDDGVVKYTSAHVDYVESEFIVQHDHSCQSHPLVIEEIRRILLEHLQENRRLTKAGVFQRE